MKADLFPLVWVVSAAKLQPPFSSPALRSLHGRPDRSGSLRSTDLQSLSLSLSRPHLANDEADALYHGYACSESTSASLRPKFCGLVRHPRPVRESSCPTWSFLPVAWFLPDWRFPFLRLRLRSSSPWPPFILSLGRDVSGSAEPALVLYAPGTEHLPRCSHMDAILRFVR